MPVGGSSGIGLRRWITNSGVTGGDGRCSLEVGEVVGLLQASPPESGFNFCNKIVRSK